MAKLVDLDNLTTALTTWIGTSDGTTTQGTGAINTSKKVQGGTLNVAGKATLQYDSTENCLDIVFS